ncbi:MAG: DNA repair protein RecO [Chloroflexi bacterium]|nr:DNA repair protein RecO [Chloroflexota bacterium]
MTTPRSYNTEAVVLRRIESGEADRIITLFTPEHGKVKAIARGVRKPKSKLAGTVEMFTHCSLQISRGHGLDVIGQGEAIHPFLPLKTDLNRSSCAFYLVDLVNRFTEERQENAQLFGLLVSKLVELCDAAATEIVIRHFEVDLLQLMGYRPNLRHCVDCNSIIEPKTNAFSPAGGGLICPECAGKQQACLPVSVNAIKVLRLLQGGEYAMARRVNLGEKLASELQQVLRCYIEYLLERRVKSADWMDKIRHESQTG